MSDSRELLLTAAAEEFAKHGPKGTRVQDIVKAAGVNERMIYHHFGSKEGLYTAVMKDQRSRLGAAWQPILEQALTLEPYEGMRLALGGFFETLLNRPQVAAMFVHEALGNGPLGLPEGVQGFPEQLRTLYERGQAEKVFPAEVPFEVAYGTAIGALIAMIIFAPRMADFARAGFAEPGLDTDPVRLREQVVRQLLDGMTG
ncbi:TetR/AcrR family transcriptional regulator [Actinomadura scrupuli]|uniref:TetR/AcrR family transcriptional regulator n=1 Tax=Actinomadura scrupuli TaxID=559629 RepID=UPI003D98F4E9